MKKKNNKKEEQMASNLLIAISIGMSLSLVVVAIFAVFS